MEEIEPSDEYLKGFNQGYYIQQSNPKLASSVANGINSPSDYLDGFNDGGKEYEMERIQREFDEIEKSRSQDRDNDLGIER